MPLLMLKEVPRYECMQEASAQVPGADPSSCEVFLNILHTGDVVSRAEESFLSAYGLNQARLIILMLLDESEGSLRSSELAEQANVSRATMTGLLDTLERAELVARAIDPQDRRALNVKITSKGEALLNKIRTPFFKWSSEILSALTPREKSQLVTLLRKTQEAFKKPA